MCFDPKGIVVEKIGRHVGPEARIFDAARSPEVPALDPESEKQAQAGEAELEAWLRSRGGQPWMDGIVLECLERFPRLDRFQVSAVIYKLRDEDLAAVEKASAKESVERLGIDPTKLPERELTAILENGSK